MRRVLLACFGVFLALLMASSPGHTQSRRWGEGHFPNLTVVDQDGRKLRFYDDVIKGRQVVISFIYTSCTDICPLTTSRLSLVAEQLGESFGRDIFFVSLSVDPVNDTPERLKAHAQAFHAGPGWLFLSGSLEHMRAINGSFGERMRALNEHRNEIVLGNDATGEWARNSAFGDLGRLVVDIRSMDPNWRPMGHASVQHALEDKSAHDMAPVGQSLFKRFCAGCHSLGVGNRVGPDLHGVTGRRSREWLVRFIMNPEQMRKQQDQTALALTRQFPSVRMPRLGMTENDASDLVSYLDNRTARLDEQRREAAANAAQHDHDHQHHDHQAAGQEPATGHDHHHGKHQSGKQ